MAAGIVTVDTSVQVIVLTIPVTTVVTPLANMVEREVTTGPLRVVTKVVAGWTMVETTVS